MFVPGDARLIRIVAKNAGATPAVLLTNSSAVV